ncbi:MAG: tetratricopeptide repeat protein, partial [Candidatus Obscuribacterales bacterium]|nr:tetratricopeptide repeat protein [Candidatus Obscuribacterales bacterium]
MTKDSLKCCFSFALAATVLIAEKQLVLAIQQSETINPQLQFHNYSRLGHEIRPTVLLADVETNGGTAAASFLSSGRSKFAEGKYQQAIDYFNQAIESDPNNSIAYYSRALILRHLGQSQKAKEDWLKSLSIDPTLANGRLGKYQNIFNSAAKNSEKQDADSSASFIGKSFIFVNPEDSFATEFFAGKDKLDSWSPGDKTFFLQVIENIQRKSPELIAKACNGKEIRLMLSRHASGISSMDTSPVRTMCFPLSLRFTPRELEWALTHEFAHIIDTSQVLSDGKDLRAVYSPYRSRYLAVQKDVSSIKFDL